MAVRDIVLMGFSGGGVSFIPTLGYSSAEVVQQTDFDDDEVWRAGRRRNYWRARMPRIPSDSNYADNVLTAFPFTDRTYLVDLTQWLAGVTLSSIALQAQENDADPAADDLTIDEVQAISSEATLYNGATILGTVATGKGFTFRATGGDSALYTLTFTYTDSDGDTDGVSVRLRVA
jgi:hypothetical protein